MSAARLRQLVGLDEARRRAVGPGERGRAAGRHLEAIAVHLGFYLARELMAANDYRRRRLNCRRFSSPGRAPSRGRG